MEQIVYAIKKVSKRYNLTIEESMNIMKDIMNGKVKSSQLGAFLVAMAMKGETVDELIGFARIMRKYAKNINPSVKNVLVDTCGTGGDKIKTFNISTITAFVIAGAGIYVAKHGNRAVTSKCGSADLLEGLGVNINLSPERVKECIENVGIGFMFAPLFHPAMKHAMPIRQELKIRTVFNILGPLTNPAGAKCHVLGVFDKSLLSLMAKALGEGLGGKHVFTVHNSSGIDELAPVGINYLSEYHDNSLENYAITNEDFGIPSCVIEDLHVPSREDHFKIAVNILKNRLVGAKHNTILMNSALALKSSGLVNDFVEGIEIASQSIETGRAYEKLEQLIEFSEGNIARLKQYN
ncbi:MAG: anthranilate phosphoribosyltransferase [Candidatus Lokiarchaeota archaeon]|nr:anthranilate phosphoribosyltransferase [Candidatus Lokiarchaeota archaeon]